MLYSCLQPVCYTINAVQLVNIQFRGEAFEVIELWLRKCRAALNTQHPLYDTRLEVMKVVGPGSKGGD